MPLSLYICVCVYVCMHVCIYVCVYIYKLICIYIYIHIYIYAYIYIHIDLFIALMRRRLASLKTRAALQSLSRSQFLSHACIWEFPKIRGT